jgi:pimeloyl-ACP methyl ester carboxylesterase
VADRIVETAKAAWAPRFVQAGVDFNDFLRTTAEIESWDGWLDAWDRLGDRHAALAREAEAAGQKATAGDAWLRAAVAYHFARHVWVRDPSRSRPVHEKSVAANYAAHRMLETGLERIEFPLDGSHIVGNLRHPGHSGRPPLVLVIPGLDSTKEEFFHTEEAFLRRGMATVSLDGPGQGESTYDLPLRHDYEVAIRVVLDALAERTDLDMDRVGVFGVSMGGYYAPRAAVFEPRLKAVVGLSGPARIVDTWDEKSELMREVWLARTHSMSDEEARGKVAKLDLTDVLGQLEQPALFVTGDQDFVVPWEQTARQAELAPNARFVNIAGGGHGVPNFPYLWRPLVTDWMRRQLG